MKRLTWGLAALCVLISVGGTVIILRQRTELVALRETRSTFDAMCRREAGHARFLLASTQGNIPKDSRPLREFGVKATLKACLPGAEFPSWDKAEGCWLQTGEAKCALPVLTEIVAEYDRRWP